MCIHIIRVCYIYYNRCLKKNTILLSFFSLYPCPWQNIQFIYLKINRKFDEQYTISEWKGKDSTTNTALQQRRMLLLIIKENIVEFRTWKRLPMEFSFLLYFRLNDRRRLSPSLALLACLSYSIDLIYHTTSATKNYSYSF